MLGLVKTALQLDEPRILVEQLRLIYAGMTVSIVPMFPAIFLLVWVLTNDSNRIAMLLWGIFMSGVNVYVILNARQRLSMGISMEQATSLVRRLMVSMAVGGSCWGFLAYSVLGNTTAVGSIVVISVLAGILGGSMSLLSSVLPVFVAFSVPMVSITVSRLWQLDDPAYSAFGVISLLYLGVLIAQTKNSSRATRAAIELRFENLELMREAQAARLEAEEANTAKSKFLAAASHDLRQPIHAQGLFLDVLTHTPLDARQRELVGNISATSQASAEMLNTLLDFSRIEAGVVKPQLEPFRIQQVLNKIEREFESQADAKGLDYRSRETAEIVLSDPALVELIVRNLVSNAIRYTEHGGLLVACRKRGEQTVLEVWDTGIGIAPEQQAEVFKEFHQLGNPERDRRKGLGLGLAIAQGLCKTLDHELTLRSRPAGGTVFMLHLPSVGLIPAARLVAISDAASLLRNDLLLRGIHVLVIDDDATVLAAMVQLLQHWGCHVYSASSIEQALTLARLQAPEVLICDYRLRGLRTGDQAIAAVREMLSQWIPALLVTGDTAPERLREAISSGIPLLHKPLKPGDFHEALIKILSDRQTRAR